MNLLLSANKAVMLFFSFLLFQSFISLPHNSILRLYTAKSFDICNCDTHWRMNVNPENEPVSSRKFPLSHHLRVELMVFKIFQIKGLFTIKM